MTEEEINKQLEEVKPVTFKMFFTNMRAMITIVSAAIAMIFMLFFNAILAPHLDKKYGIKED